MSSKISVRALQNQQIYIGVELVLNLRNLKTNDLSD